MGPLVSAQQRDRVQAYIDGGPAEGATLAYRGSAARPTLRWRADTSCRRRSSRRPTPQRIAREEIFGPVAAVIPFTEVDEVVALSNDTEYGLAAAIWTRDIGLALRTARAVRAGVVWINDSQPAPSETMWGGYKQSGIGRELGPYALDAYLETKQIYINLS